MIVPLIINTSLCLNTRDTKLGSSIAPVGRRSNNQTSPVLWSWATAQHVSLQLFKAFPLTMGCPGERKQTIITHLSFRHPHSEIHHSTTITRHLTAATITHAACFVHQHTQTHTEKK